MGDEVIAMGERWKKGWLGAGRRRDIAQRKWGWKPLHSVVNT